MSKAKWTNLKIVADKILRDPIFIGLNFESIIDYFIDFITIVGVPELFDEKFTNTEIPITNYRAVLPDDFLEEIVVSIDQKVARTATDLYFGNYQEYQDLNPNEYFPDKRSEPTYKIKGGYIYLSKKEGNLLLKYKCIATETDTESEDFGIPLLPDDPVFILALQSYIEIQFLKILFRAGKINSQVLQLAQQDYAWNVGRYETHSRRLTYGDMETLSKQFKSILTRNNEFRTRFSHLGNR